MKTGSTSFPGLRVRLSSSPSDIKRCAREIIQEITLSNMQLEIWKGLEAKEEHRC